MKFRERQTAMYGNIVDAYNTADAYHLFNALSDGWNL